MVSLAAALLALAAALLAPASAGAAGDQPARIALIVDRPDDRLGMLLRYEIESLGLVAISVVVPPSRTSPRELEAVARGAQAVAAIHIVPSATALEVWIADRVTGKIVLREIVRDGAAADGADPAAGGAVADNVVVLRTIELLRASLMESAAPHPSRGEVVATPALRPLIEASAPTGGTLAVGPALLASPGGVGALAAAVVDLSWAVTPRLLLDVWGLLPLPGRVDAAEGSATVSPRLVAAGVARRWAPPARRAQASLGIAAAAIWMHVVGDARAPYVAGSDDHVSPALLAHLTAGLALAPHLRLGGELAGGAAAQSTAVRFAGTAVATWGRPLLLAGVRLEVAWP